MIKQVKIGEYHDQPELSDIRSDAIAHFGVSGEVEEVGGVLRFESDDASLKADCYLLKVDIGVSTEYNVWSLFTNTWELVDLGDC
jgi:hypothetical protein